MLYLLAIVFLLGTGNADETTFDCPMRQLALEFAAYIQPDLSTDKLQEIADALNGAAEKKEANCTVSPSLIDPKILGNRNPTRQPKDWSSQDHLFKPSDNEPIYLFVDAEKGDDFNNGKIDSPFKTISMAITKSRSFGPKTLKYIILRKGRHYLTEPINITPRDNNLIIRNYDGELSEVSGSVNLTCRWKLYKNMTNNQGIYTCDLVGSSISEIPGLRVNGNRGIRARYPNANPELDGFGSTLKAVQWYSPAPPYNPDYDYFPLYPDRPGTLPDGNGNAWFAYYKLGMGGTCDNFSPSGGYWCSSETQGGGAFTYRIPDGLQYNSTLLPNSPYADLTGAVVQAWRPGHWSSWMFLVDEETSTNDNLMFEYGGFQGARGNNNGDEFYVENIFEELDYPTEYFYNSTTSTLYYYNNDTGEPTQQFEATNVKILFNITGTNMTSPAVNISIQGVTLRDTSYTYLDPHGMPSGGDWGLQRQGAITSSYVENLIISDNLMTRLDGNAVSINRYARNVTIDSNEVVWNGDNVFSNWGDTDGIEFENFVENGYTTEMGYDGTNGNQPRGVIIQNNFVHEIGIWEKQSSMYFQAKSCQNLLQNNIFFNGPRAGINFNDGFGGGSKLYKNLLFNTCRESGDHGPFNSWDRQVYVTTVNDGTPSTTKAYDEITQNFMIANYNSQEAIDNDDGSAYYNTHNNFFIYSGNGMKNDFGGHNNLHRHNIYAYTGLGFNIVEQMAGYNDEFTNNTLVLTGDQPNYGKFDCNGDTAEYPRLGDNYVCTEHGDPTVTGLCNLDEANFQSKYSTDYGTTINVWPDDTDLINQAYNLLWA